MSNEALDPRLLQTFLTVFEAGRVSAAAKELHLSQPAVTAQLRKLEETLETPLFLRSVRGVTPTEAGLRLADRARAIQTMIDETVRAVKGNEEKTSTLVLGASTTIAAHVLPPLLAKFRASNRGVAFRVIVGNTEEVVEHVRAGRVPLGLVEGHARASAIRLEPCLDDEIVPVVGEHAPFRVKSVADLETTPLLWRESGSGTRAVVERALRTAGVNRRAIRAMDVELRSTEAILGGAAAGLGVAFVSRISARPHTAAGLVRVVPGLDLVIRRTFRWALPAGALRGTAARFHAFAQRHVV